MAQTSGRSAISLQFTLHLTSHTSTHTHTHGKLLSSLILTCLSTHRRQLQTECVCSPRPSLSLSLSTRDIHTPAHQQLPHRLATIPTQIEDFYALIAHVCRQACRCAQANRRHRFWRQITRVFPTSALFQLAHFPAVSGGWAVVGSRGHITEPRQSG